MVRLLDDPAYPTYRAGSIFMVAFMVKRVLLREEPPTYRPPMTLRLPPEMPTGAVEMMSSWPVVRLPPMMVSLEFEEVFAEKIMLGPESKSAVGEPLASVDQLFPAVQAVPFEPSQ